MHVGNLNLEVIKRDFEDEFHVFREIWRQQKHYLIILHLQIERKNENL